MASKSFRKVIETRGYLSTDLDPTKIEVIYNLEDLKPGNWINADFVNDGNGNIIEIDGEVSEEASDYAPYWIVFVNHTQKGLCLVVLPQFDLHNRPYPFYETWVEVESE
jgi:hypothetical protein